MSEYMIETATKIYRASGKLMFFGEYMVLKGAPCLAIPLRFGQTLQVEEMNLPGIEWESYELDRPWFSAVLDKNLHMIRTSDVEKADVLINLLIILKKHQPELFEKGLRFRAQSDFNLQWGFGSSSTLVSLLAQWSGVNPYVILENSFGGSGYDIACATAEQPITYNVKDRLTENVQIAPEITSQLLFIYSGNKQNSRNEIKRFAQRETSADDVQQIETMIQQSLAAKTIGEFETQLNASEELISEILGLQPLKAAHFSDYPYSIKSLGAWGGDFFMATFRDEQEAKTYFKQKGYDTILRYDEVVYSN
jgi:mevalonate kinase